MDDPPVDFGQMTRSAILKELGLTKLKQNTDKLRGQLVRHLLTHHPINSFLSSLQLAEVKKIYQKLVKEPTIKHHDRMKKFIVEEFFKNYPRAPLTSLKQFLYRTKSHQFK